MTSSALSALTPEQQRQRIAEVCGWNPCPLFDCPSWTQHPSGMIGPFVFDLPDYLNDLNAIAGAEQMLSSHDWGTYTMNIRRIIQEECDRPECYVPGTDRAQLIADYWFYHATALQRAQAFLLTV